MPTGTNIEFKVLPSEQNIVTVTRFLLSLSALLVIVLNPNEPDRLVVETYLLLIIYTLYSAVILLIDFEKRDFIRPLLNYSHWIDVAWYVVLISLSNGTNSIFFFFFFFAILHGAFRFGFRTGVTVAIVSAAAFTIVGYFTAFDGRDLEPRRLMLRPIYLLILGYMISYWGAYVIRVVRRLEFLRDIGSLANPRFGVEQTININIELLRKFYEADLCLLLVKEGSGNSVRYYRSLKAQTLEGRYEIRSSNATTEQLFSLPEKCSAIYESKRAIHIFLPRQTHIKNGPDEDPSNESNDVIEMIAENLGSNTFLTIPVYHQSKVVGRLFLISNIPKVFKKADLDFVEQAVNQIMPIIANIRLVDHLATDAAEFERKRIARDIHDSVIQPYIGMKLGIESIIQLLDRSDQGSIGNTDETDVLRDRIDRLNKLAEHGIANLREYIYGLNKSAVSGSVLTSSVQRFAEKFSSATGIQVEVRSGSDLKITDRLAAEVFQIITEGLSNIRKHTLSELAVIEIEAFDNKLILAINNRNNDIEMKAFRPSSIAERVGSLGGSLDILLSEDITTLSIQIPL